MEFEPDNQFCAKAKIWAEPYVRKNDFKLSGGLSEGYGHGGPGVCLGDGQTEAFLKDMGMAGLVSTLAMARRSP